MSKEKATVPKWVADLKSPQPTRNKVAGIADPPGFPSQALTSSSKVYLYPDPPDVDLVLT
jgi:hypothetical protein